MHSLFQLQTLEFEETIQPDTEKKVELLRATIPAPVLAHYDRLGARGKKGVAILRNQSCTACHMHVPIGVVLDLKRGEDVCLCGCCGRYLYLPEETAPVARVPLAKKAAKAGSVKADRKELALAL